MNIRIIVLYFILIFPVVAECKDYYSEDEFELKYQNKCQLNSKNNVFTQFIVECPNLTGKELIERCRYFLDTEIYKTEWITGSIQSTPTIINTYISVNGTHKISYGSRAGQIMWINYTIKINIKDERVRFTISSSKYENLNKAFSANFFCNSYPFTDKHKNHSCKGLWAFFKFAENIEACFKDMIINKIYESEFNW